MFVARFMGDNNVLSGTVSARDGARLTVETTAGPTVTAVAPDAEHAVGDRVLVSVRAAASRLDDGAGGGPNTAECEIVFVEFLGDLVKLHLAIGEERMLVKVPGEAYSSLRGREGERIRISWKEDDVQLLRA